MIVKKEMVVLVGNALSHRENIIAFVHSAVQMNRVEVSSTTSSSRCMKKGKKSKANQNSSNTCSV